MIDFIVYGISFTYVIVKAKKNTTLRNFGKVPLLIIAFPNLYFFVGLLGRVLAYARSDIDSCFLFKDYSPFGYVTQAIGIFNALLINVFMLRVFHVAAILKCETKNEEVTTEQRINIIRIIYLPMYFVLQCAIFTVELWLYSNKAHSREVMAGLIITLNLLKECLTGTLGIYVLIFACRLQNIIDELVYQWGNSPPAIARLRTIRNYLIMMGVTYLSVDIIFNIVYPGFEAAHELKEINSGIFNDENNATLQLAADIEV